MTDESESYYYSKNLPLGIGSSASCRAFVQDFSYSIKRSLAEHHADIWVQYMQALASKKSNKRTTPPVPKFEDTQKKLKLNIENTISDVNSYSLPSYGTTFNSLVSNCLNVNNDGSENHTLSINNLNSLNKVKVIKVIPETHSYDELFSAASKKVKVQQKYLEKCETNMSQLEAQSSPSTEDEEEKVNVNSPKLSVTSPTNALKPISLALSPEPLDKKDEKKFQKFLECLNLYTERLNITNSQVVEKFKDLARITIPKLVSHFKSKPFEAVAAAVLLYACRETDYPITLKQIVSASDTKEKLINKCIFSLKEIMPTETEVKHFKAGEYIQVLTGKLNVTAKIKTAATKIWENIEKLNFIKSIHAVTLAACCLKFACSLSDDDREFEAIADAAGITKMTLKNMYRELFPYRFYFITADCMLRDPKELKNF